MGRQKGNVHVLVVPFPDGQGHINPILQFSKRLAFKGLKVTVLNVFRSHESSNLNLNASINVEQRPRLPYEGTEPESLESNMNHLRTSMCFHVKELVSQHRSSGSPIGCVVYDSINAWVLDVVKGLGIPGATFFTESCAVNAIFYHVHRGWLKIPIEESSVSLPGLPVLQISDLPSLISNPQQYPCFLRFMIDQFSIEADWMFINTFNILEPEVIKWIQSHIPLKTVGPTVPSMIVDKRLKDDCQYGISLFESNGDDDSDVMAWLDSKNSGSVIYVSFGSVVQLGEEQMEELARGLEATSRSFLWVVRESEISKLPSNLLEETKERGMVVKWCPQLQVLAHKSVGCFVTHCGWNSVMEALSLGVPMVAMPQWTDQMTNAKCVEEAWKVGVRVSPKENAIAGREEIELCIKQVMEGERSVEIRENARRWMKLAKEAVDEEGTSDKNIDEFVAELTARKM